MPDFRLSGFCVPNGYVARSLLIQPFSMTAGT